MSHELMQSIQQFRVDKGTAAVWWLGQMGYLVKTPQGAIVAVDAYLTNSCAAIGDAMGVDLNRRVPVFIPPEALDVDYFLCTHSHQDHADPETISQMRRDGVQLFAGPGMACEVFAKCGVDATRTRQLYAGGKTELADLRVHGTFAMPTDDSDVNHMGFVLEVEGGPRIYISGDTDYSDRLGHVAQLQPDVMIACINGGFNNMSHWEAAEVAGMLKPKIAIPCHYDMFPDNAGDPEQFRAALRHRSPNVRYERLQHVTPFVVGG